MKAMKENHSAGAARQNMFANQPVKSLLWRLALPAMGGMLSMALYNVVDTIFVGRGVGSLAITGVTLAFPVMMFTMALGQMVGIGAASIVSRNLGAGDLKKAESTLGNAVALTVIMGLVMTVLALLNISTLLEWFGASDVVAPYARDYLSVVLVGTLFAMFAMGINNIARAEGNARVAMMCMILGAGINIILDPVFIFLLDMGVRGAAIATVISQVLQVAFLIRYFISSKSTLRLSPAIIRLHGRLAREILAVGAPAFVRMGAASLMVLIINRTLGFYSGDMAIAAFGIANRAMMFAAMPLMGIAQGLQPVLGFSYGARQYRRALEVTRYALFVGTCVSVIGFLFLALVPEPIVRIFTTDPVLIEQGVYAAERMFVVFFLVGFQIVGSTVFQALGKVTKSFITSTSRQVLFFIPLVLVLPRFLQADGVWLTFPLSDALSFVLTAALIVPQLREFSRKMDEPLPVVTGATSSS
ncbi:MAG: MATE family efflux transporter [Dehalococcoidia bacterium]|nr:MATE family efflux transporter [Dehalococcoidia bacterium]